MNRSLLFCSHAPLKHALTSGRKHALPPWFTIGAVDYGNRLAEALKLANKTRLDLATHLGVSTQAIGQVITGDTEQLKANNSAKAAAFLRVDHHWLATGEGVPRPKPPLSPLSFELALQFDKMVPLPLRDMAYAQVMGLIALVATVDPQATPLPAGPATPAPRQNS